MSVRTTDCHPYISHFFFNDPATTEIYTLSLHDALPIFGGYNQHKDLVPTICELAGITPPAKTKFDGRSLMQIVEFRFGRDRKSTRLNSSHRCISYAVFCLKKKKKNKKNKIKKK